MSSLLFEQLDNSGFVRNGELNLSLIEHSSPIDIIDFAQESINITSAENFNKDNSVFSHSASLALGGGRSPCASLECRIKKVKELTQFATFYADRVYIHNFLGDYKKHVDRPLNETEIRKNFADDLRILLELRPLIESGRIIPITAPYYCPHCLVKHSFGQEDDRRLRKAINWLIEKYNKNLVISLLAIDKNYFFLSKGPESLLEHGSQVFLTHELHPALKKMPNISAKIKLNKETRLTKAMVKKIEYDKHLAYGTFQSILFELATSQCLNTCFLSDKAVEIEFLMNVSNNFTINRRNKIVQKYLTCLVPFINHVSTSELIKLRNREEESFLIFRQVLAKAIDEHKAKKDEFTEKDAKQIYQDIIEPQLAILDRKIKIAHKSLIKGTIQKVLSWTGAISFGLYSGFLPSGLTAAASALGLTKILADFTESFMNKKDVELMIRDQDMYFLWKVRRAGTL